VGVLLAGIHQEDLRPNSSYLLYIRHWHFIHGLEYRFLAERTTEVKNANQSLERIGGQPVMIEDAVPSGTEVLNNRPRLRLASRSA
jgi:hypothetical protein